MEKVQNFSDVKNAVRCWFLKLQHERKCTNTNLISKLVNNSTEDVQEQVRQLLSNDINEMVGKCKKSKDLTCMLNACNTINGCFDNFTHAADAVRYSFKEVLAFVDCTIDECQLETHKNGKTLIVVLELLHCLSRVLILILKLRRVQSKEIAKSVSYPNQIDNRDEKEMLACLTCKISPLLMRDDVLIDTKNNIAMAGILIREILTPEEEKLRLYHKRLLASIPSNLTSESSKTYLVQFLISTAVLNTWSTKILDPESTLVYLKFFINLCEKFSSETPIILNTSRTLFLLIKHKCFKELLTKEDTEKIKEITESLLSCIFMLLEHPVPCVRHSAKEFPLILVSYPLLQSQLIQFAFRLPKDKRSYFIYLGAIAGTMGSRVLISRNNDLPKQLLESIYDATMVSHVSYALENMILKDSLAEEKFPEWCELWIIPLLVMLKNVLPIISAEIDKLLENAFKKYPECVIYVTDKWKHPKSGEELRCVITALKISQRQNYKFNSNHSTRTGDEGDALRNKSKSCGTGTENKWKTLISDSLLEHCLHHGEDEIRVSAFALVIEARRSTEPYSSRDFNLIKYFLKYNINNQQPATRQKIISLIRKMLVRFYDSRTCLRKIKNNSEIAKENVQYDEFLNFLVEFCFANIFAGCNFNRLNTVLNILLVCFETIKDMSFKPENTNYYWTKLLIALDSSYEENKELAVVLSKTLDFSSLDAATHENVTALFEKSFSLISHMEPPDVLTGSYLLQVLINLPSAKKALAHFLDEAVWSELDVHYCCIQILTTKLKEQVHMAKLDLMTAATCGPMYGTLSAIRLIFKDVGLRRLCDNGVLTEKDKSSILKWKEVLNDLVEICFEMIPTVSSVVNSSSPEGHLPMDFQTDFEERLKITCSEDSWLTVRNTQVMNGIIDSYIQKFNKIKRNIENGGYDSYEILRALKCLIKENRVLCSKLNSSPEVDSLKRLEGVKEEIEELLENLDKNKSAVDWPATAQVLLLCAWRSIKEASLYLGDFVSKLTIETAIELDFLSKETIMRIGEELKVLLCEIKHRGSFEHVYVAFTQFVNSLWQCSDPTLCNLPKLWLEEIAHHLELPIKEQKLKLCSTRRSAGLPFLIQAVICSEIVSVKSPTPSTLHTIMSSLLRITEKGVAGNSDSIIHALNILRALFKHTQLGEHVSSYISKALMVAIRGSRGPTWSERNSSNLLFSSLIIRIFGVTRSREQISRKNRMTSRTFFQRYSEMYDFLLSEMKFIHESENCSSHYPKPSLFLILLILGRLYPTPREDAEVLDLSEFLPFINKSRRNPVMKIRELAARALVPLIPPDRLLQELNERFALLRQSNNLSQNEVHGVLLQIKALLRESVDNQDVFKSRHGERSQTSWIENSSWILSANAIENKIISPIVVSSYIKVLHILFKYMPCSREKVSEFILSFVELENVHMRKQSKIKSHPGGFLYVADFCTLKVDVLARKSQRTGNFNEFLEYLTFMLGSNFDEVRLFPLRILCFLLRNEEDVAEYGAAVSELFALQKKEDKESLRKAILEHVEIPKYILKALAGPNAGKFKVSQRLWLKSLGGLVTDGGLSFSRKSDLFDPKTTAEGLLRSEDKEISSNALVVYGVSAFEEIAQNSDRRRMSEKMAELSTTLKNFSTAESDVKDKLAVARILNHCFGYLIEMGLIEDLNIWMVPIKLLLDEDSTVRSVATSFVCQMQVYMGNLSKKQPLSVQMEILNWPVCNLVPLKAQECLLDSYVNICREENLINLFSHMLVLALSSYCSTSDNDNLSNYEFGVFEKGNPNPFYEDLAVSRMICDKFRDLEERIDFNGLMRKRLNQLSYSLLVENFNLPNFTPVTLMNVIEQVKTADIADGEKGKEFSVPRMQRKSLMDALGLKEV